MALNIYIRFTSLAFGSCFRILAVISSKPGAFLWSNILISPFVSFKVNALRHSWDRMGVPWFVPLPDHYYEERNSERYSAHSPAFP